MSTKYRIGLFLLVAVILVGLQLYLRPFLAGNQVDHSMFNYHFPYDLAQPDSAFSLPVGLNEISGLSNYDEQHILALQDEKGQVFVLDAETGKLVNKIKFAKSGDYEGVAVARKKVYTLRSDGDLYRIKHLDDEDQKTKKYETDLEAKNDTEGLCFDADNNRLLIACKGDPGKKKLKKHRAVYAFDLDKKKLSKDPVFTVSLKEIEKLTNNPKAEFAPSGIAIHPVTKDIYMISTVGKLLIVLSPDNQILYVHPLDPQQFKQPEGITFRANGDLLISNEARYKSTNATLFRFNYQGT